ncbi:class V aminotransferase [Candidatus Tenderia electrophaga]|jgi:selenocysteine lyase/cysteine desulfurase|uniref:Class V aminotransferase n=1 Tax=Candidatus Tenderia electrophaga TaxID=1748243 RepID=A0A0S2TDW8_9GAMM|nr:class V aminotransferase [Candidatus Tenderia electrophaga]
MPKSDTQQFPHLEHMIHLNHAAVAPWPAVTRDAVRGFADENARLGSSHYPAWLKLEQLLRRQLAELINAPSADDIALVKNTSEALSFVAYGLEWQVGHNIVSSDQEFPSNRIVWESLGQYGVEFREADLNSGASPEEALFAKVDQNTRMITISSIQYASGLRMDLERIGRFCRENGILFCVDAIQSVGAVQFDVQAVKADFVMADGHKWMLGPEGLGFFYCRPELREQLKLTQYGWHMVDPLGNYTYKDWKVAKTARRFECGSPNMIAIHALQASIQLLLETGMDLVERRLLENSRYLCQRIDAMQGVELLTNTDAGRYGGIVSFTAGDKDDEIFQTLQQRNVFCALRGGGIRFSPHFYTPRALLDEALEVVARGL